MMGKEQRWMLKGYLREKLRQADQSDMFSRKGLRREQPTKAAEKTLGDILIESKELKLLNKILTE